MPAAPAGWGKLQTRSTSKPCIVPQGRTRCPDLLFPIHNPDRWSPATSQTADHHCPISRRQDPSRIGHPSAVAKTSQDSRVPQLLAITTASAHRRLNSSVSITFQKHQKCLDLRVKLRPQPQRPNHQCRSTLCCQFPGPPRGKQNKAVAAAMG